MGLSGSVSAAVGFDAALGEINHRLDRIAGLLERPVGKRGDPNPVRSPRPIKFAATKKMSNTTYNFVKVGGPPRGFVWDLRRLFITGADPFTAVTGNVFPFVSAGGGAPIDDSATEPANFPEIISNNGTTTIPYRDAWPRGTALLLPQEELYIMFKSVANATVLWIYGQAVLWTEDDFEGWGGL